MRIHDTDRDLSRLRRYSEFSEQPWGNFFRSGIWIYAPDIGSESNDALFPLMLILPLTKALCYLPLKIYDHSEKRLLSCVFLDKLTICCVMQPSRNTCLNLDILTFKETKRRTKRKQKKQWTLSTLVSSNFQLSLPAWYIITVT